MTHAASAIRCSDNFFCKPRLPSLQNSFKGVLDRAIHQSIYVLTLAFCAAAATDGRDGRTRRTDVFVRL